MVAVDQKALATIGAIYETALNTHNWSRALDHLTSETGGHGAMLMVNDPEVRELQITVMSSNYAGSAAIEYVSSKTTKDELRWLDALDAAPARAILRDADVWPDRAAYADMPSVRWLKSRGLYNRCAARLCAHGGWRDIIAIMYSAERDGITGAEERHFEVFLPHLARAIESQRPFVLLERRYRAVLSMLDRLGIGVAVIRQNREIAILNKEASRILEADDGLRRDPLSRLAATDDTNAASFSRAVAFAAQAAALKGLSTGTAMTIDRRSDGSSAYSLDIVPFREDGVEFSEPFAGALIFIIDPDQRAMISTAGLAHTYALTSAESAVCRLIADGMTAGEIADDRNVTIETVRTQTKSILSKTHTRNRVELVRRAMSIVPPLVDEFGRRQN